MLNISLFEAIVPKVIIFITSVREPFSCFVSTLYFFHIALVMTDKENPIEIFLKNIDYNDRKFGKAWWSKNESIPNLLRNNLAFDLGFKVVIRLDQ